MLLPVDNKIGEKGISAFVKALQYQTTLSQFPILKATAEETVTLSTKNAKEKETISTPVAPNNRFPGTGLMRLCLQVGFTIMRIYMVVKESPFLNII